MTVHLVSMSREAYSKMVSQIPPQLRFTLVDERVPATNVWFQVGDNIVMFSPTTIEKLECRQIFGIGGDDYLISTIGLIQEQRTSARKADPHIDKLYAEAGSPRIDEGDSAQ